jgi:hypothetical protein
MADSQFSLPIMAITTQLLENGEINLSSTRNDGLHSVPIAPECHYCQRWLVTGNAFIENHK